MIKVLRSHLGELAVTIIDENRFDKALKFPIYLF